MADHKYDPLVWLGDTLGIRNKDGVGRKGLRVHGRATRPRVRRPEPETTAPVAEPERGQLAPYARGEAMAALVLGVLSTLTLNALFGLVAIGLGRAAQRGSRRADAAVHRRATTGVVAGCIGTLLSLLAAAVLLVVYVMVEPDWLR